MTAPRAERRSQAAARDAHPRAHARRSRRAAKALGKAGNNGAVWVALGVVLAIVDSASARSLADLRRARADRDRAQLRDQAARQAAAPGARGAAAARRRAQLAQLPLRPRDLVVRGGDGDDPGRPGVAALAFVLALALSLGRPYLGMHYPSDVLAGALLGIALGLIVPLSAMKVGIVGLPNAGKSTLFNALTKGGAQTGDYPFTTIEPNVAIAQVPDERLEQVAETVRSSELVPATISFHDIAGLVKGASEGEGLGNQFLASIRETDAICHVVRCHARLRRAPSRRPRRPARRHRDDRDRADRSPTTSRPSGACDRVGKGAKSGDAEAIAERDWLEQVVAALAAGKPARSVPVPDAAAHGPRNLQALTSKPILYVANVDEGDAEPPRGGRRPRRPRSAPGWSRSAPGSRASWPSSTRPKRRRCASPTGSRARAWRASSAPPTTCST